MIFKSVNYLYHEIKWKLIYKKLKKIQLLVLDVDGVLTDGSLLIGNENETFKFFNVKDGLAIKLLQECGIEVIFISGGTGGAIENRAKQLGIKNCFVGAENKYKVLRNFQEENKISISCTAYIGDDINDIVIRPIVSLLFGPFDASDDLLNISDMRLSHKGGKGAVRELGERILKAKGLFWFFSKKGWINKNL